MKPRLRLSILLAILAGLLIAVQARALDPARDIAQYMHTKWTIADGAPAGIQNIVQSADGYLWLGTATGLYRFDGIAFERIPPIEEDKPRSENVTALLALPSGDVWVGYYYGGIAVYHEGKLRDFNHGPPQGAVDGFAQDADGGIWVATSGLNPLGLSRYADGKWQTFDAASGIPREQFEGILASPDGTVWVVTRDSVLVLRRGATLFERVGDRPSTLAEDGFKGVDGGLATDSQGRAWISDCAGVRLLGNGSVTGTDKAVLAVPGPCPRGGATRGIIFDRDGSLWGTTHTDGLVRIRSSSLVAGSETGLRPGGGDAFRATDGLSSNTTDGIVEDREGNIWIGTSSGLDRFRAANVVAEAAIPPPSGGRYLAARDAGGMIDLADGDRVYQILPGTGPVAVSHALPGRASSFCPSADGRVFVETTTHDIFSIEDGHFKKYASAVPPILRDIFGCAMDKYGMLWISVGRYGLYRFDGKDLTEFSVFEDVPHLGSYLMDVDQQGRLLLYFGRRSLVRVDGDRTETLFNESDSKIGLIEVIAPGEHYVLLAGETGLAQLDGDRVTALSSSQYPWLGHLTGIAQTRRGETWLIGGGQIIRLSTAELEQAFAHPGSPLRYEVFDANDGLPNFASLHTFGNNSSTDLEGGDGRVWFTVTDHLAWIDPAHLARNPLPPPLSIQRLIANDRSYALPLGGALPKGVSKLEIDYTALSLTFPQRNRFLYRLDGVDDDWVDPGTRRQAFYTNLGPGHYRFSVIASNNDGVWNRAGASLDFDIPPTFLQSRLFAALCVALGLVLAWLLYSLRLRQVALRIRGRLEERLAERERIARELHDTLLQGFQGLILGFQAVAEQIPAEQPLHNQAERLLDRAENVLVEGRDRVRDLRVAQAGGELSRMLADAAASLELTPQITVVVEGTPRRLHPAICDEIMAIGKEALFNIARHAQAKSIEIGIRYDRAQLVARFLDDGVGIDQATLDQGREGHFGLTGMRERARKIRASLVITSRVGDGTEIELAIPAGVAYAKGIRRVWFWPLRRPELHEG